MIQKYNSDYILLWKSKRLSDKSIKPPAASNNSLAPALNHTGTKSQIKFDKSCLKQDKVTFIQKKMVNIYIAHELNLWPFNVSKGFALGNSFWRFFLELSN